jgi:hypothetical protein
MTSETGADEEGPRPAKKRFEELMNEWWESYKKQIPERQLQAEKARNRNKYRLLSKWEEALEKYEGAGEAELVTGYRPSGLSAPIDVPEIAGLIVCDTEDQAHHFRLYRDETISFIERPKNPHSSITIDPLCDPVPDNTIYLTNGPPIAVTQRLDVLEVIPRWKDACQDGEHDFEEVEAGPPVVDWLGANTVKTPSVP